MRRLGKGEWKGHAECGEGGRNEGWIRGTYDRLYSFYTQARSYIHTHTHTHTHTHSHIH